jgi:hypothetical protein
MEPMPAVAVLLDTPPAPPQATVEAPSPTPAPSGTKAQRPRAAGAAKKAARGRGRPPGKKQAVDAAAEAAAAALEREARGPGRPSKAEQANDTLRAGLLNFYIGLGGMLQVGGALTRVQRMRDVGQAMIVQARPCADALIAAADQSPAVRKVLEAVALGGSASLVLAAHGPILMAALGQGAPDVEVDPATDPEAAEAMGAANLMTGLADLLSGGGLAGLFPQP